MFQHKVKRNKKYNDEYKYTYVNLDFWKSFNDENLNNYIKLAIKNNYDLKIATLNVHPSLLPKYRGPSPIVSAIASGDKTTGVSIMKMALEVAAPGSTLNSPRCSKRFRW